LEDFNKAIALAPDNSEAYYDRGLLHQDEKQYQSAIDDFTAASGLVPQQTEPLLARAQSFLALDKPKEAVKDLDEAVCRTSRRTRKPGSREASPMSGSAIRPRPPAPMAAPSICVPETRRRVPALPASAASLGRATIRSDREAVRSEATAR
jgi:tetratricopeptide (TPR) repeat protein